ncbi:DUF4345 domain-containing protein [Candidatus Binatia bacterium]|nr:DUF4345 domain-containing protein [Candidatus Binatia bacterium]
MSRLDPQRLTPVLLVICGLVLTIIGWHGLTTPGELMAPLDITLVGPTAHSEIRAAYGGMHVGMGLFLLVCALRPALQVVGLWADLCIMGGLLLGRLVSVVVDGIPAGFALALLAAEATAAMAAAALLASRPRLR